MILCQRNVHIKTLVMGRADCPEIWEAPSNAMYQALTNHSWHSQVKWDSRMSEQNNSWKTSCCWIQTSQRLFGDMQLSMPIILKVRYIQEPCEIKWHMYWLDSHKWSVKKNLIFNTVKEISLAPKLPIEHQNKSTYKRLQEDEQFYHQNWHREQRRMEIQTEKSRLVRNFSVYLGDFIEWRGS